MTEPVETRGGEEERDWDISPKAKQAAENIQKLIDAYNSPIPTAVVVGPDGRYRSVSEGEPAE